MDHADELTPPPPPIRRCNNIATPIPVPTKLNFVSPKPLHSSSSLPKGTASSSPPLGLELIAFKHSAASYTSLKDLLPSFAAISSPSAVGSSSNSRYEISIRNRLVKQAAWAYLQPMASSPESSGHHFLHRVWLRVSACNPFSDCLRFLSLHLLPLLTGIFCRILRSIGIQVAL